MGACTSKKHIDDQQNNKAVTITAVSGGIRKASCTTGLLKALIQSAPSDVQINIIDISKLPIFNQDNEDKTPPEILQFISSIRQSDGFILATPCHNYSLAAASKNFIDWISRTKDLTIFENLPFAIISQGGGKGGFEAVEEGTRCFEFLKGKQMKESQLSVKQWEQPQKFNDKGDVIDEELKKQIANFTVQFKDFTIKNKKQK